LSYLCSSINTANLRHITSGRISSWPLRCISVCRPL
jgi:hypothetical protein